MNQIVVAKLTGIDQGNLSKIETGARGGVRPSHATVLALAKALGVMPSEIWRRGDEENVESEAILGRLTLVRDAASLEVQRGRMSRGERAALLRWVRALGKVVDMTTAARLLASGVPRGRADRASER